MIEHTPSRRHPGSSSTPATSRRHFLHTGAALTADIALGSRSLLAQIVTQTSPAVVATPLGKLAGETLPSGIRVFRGIPFAQPPVGPLRFRPPASPERWTNTRDSTRFAPAAMQPSDAHFAQSEDCLYLNLWTPATPGPHPVFVWIHGGGYTGGRAADAIFDGIGFARDGIVLVTVSYRLGVFGFMDLSPLLGPSFAGSGNNAILDLVAALRWVNRNIASFGGDPTQVTVGGESAGAKATAALLALPEARSLFRSAISESGGGERILTLPDATAVAQEFGAQWKRDQPANPSFSALLSAPPEALIATQSNLIAASARHFPFRPEIDGRLFTARPVDLVAGAHLTGKRLLLGSNLDESALFLGPHPASDPRQSDLGNLPLPRFAEVFPRYAALYPAMPAPQRRIRAVTAEEYWIPTVRLADAFTRSGGAAWMYRLDYTEPTGRMANQAFHSLDLSLVWNHLDPAEQADPAAAPLSSQIHTAWTAFLHGQPPAAPGLPPWNEYNSTARPTMILSRQSHLETHPLDAELRLWDGVL